MVGKEKHRELWELALANIQSQLSKPSYETWILPLEPVVLHRNALILRVTNIFNRDWLENNYAPVILNALQTVSEHPITIQFILPNEEIPQIKEESLPTVVTAKTNGDESNDYNLNPKYSFSSFVIGASNRFAHAASLAVAEAPAQAYNPLFIYGGVGLGKTHLMHAIGHYVLAHSPHLHVVYLSCEKFTNQFISSIQYKRSEEFRNRYRNVDILMVDDIQFLAGKEQTQEEFFHTFNALHEANKQIILSSDRPPREIATLEERLRSRFEWGLITDIQQPDLETRTAILKRKAEQEDISVGNDVFLHLANLINSNIRELEGALTRIHAYASFTSRPITTDLVDEVLRDSIIQDAQKIITVESIQLVVAEHFGILIEDMKAKKRTRNISYPRQIAMYLSRKLTDYSLPRLGESFGGRDHTTVLHACDKIEKELAADKNLAALLENLTKRL